MECDDVLALGELADLARRGRGGGDEVYFVQNLYLNQTNVCRVKCKFCAFAKTRKQEDAYTISAEELVEDAVKQHAVAQFTEIHCVNGENPHVDLEFYVDVLRQLKTALPDVHLKFYTASEIHHRRRRSEDDRGVAPDARQHPERQGVLDHDGDADGAARAALRRERRAGHRRA